MSEVRRNITTIVEQDEHQLLNQQRSKSTNCKHVSSKILSNCRPGVICHADSFPGYSSREATELTGEDNSREASNVHRHQPASRTKNASRVRSSKSTPSSFDYTLIDQEDYLFESSVEEKRPAKCNSIALLVVMILIYYSILFFILFNFHSSLVMRNEEHARRISENDTTSSNVSLASDHIDTLGSSATDDATDDRSTSYMSLVDLDTEDKTKRLSGRDNLINIASELTDAQRIVSLTDSSNDDMSHLGPSIRHYFDVSLDGESDAIHLHWLPDYKRDRVLFHLRFNRHLQHDWLAFGFSNDGNITHSDLCILWSDHKNQYHFEHASTDEEGFIAVQLDDINVCQFGKLSQSSTNELRLTFTRNFDPCDAHSYVIKDGTTHLVYASGRGPVKRVDGIKLLHPSSPQLAVKYGFVRTRLLRPLTSHSSTTLDTDVEVVEIVANHTHVPSQETTYWCTLHKLPQRLVDVKHHIIGYEPVITSTSLVHHMEVFHCEGDPTDFTHSDEECRDSKKPPGLERCSKVIAAWAMGANAIFYPPEAGLPLGGKSYSPYVMLEIHYNNPKQLANTIDSSGIRLFVSSRVRSHDIGVMELGLEYIDKNSIPPGQEAFSLSGFCVSECTRIGLPPTGIKIVASQLHTHLTGKRVVTRHIRNGLELPEVNRDDHYSQHFQEIRLLHEPVTVLPGDSLITTCTYDTSERKNMTLGGFAISEEMCVNYIHYYPKVDLEVCKSSIDDRFLQMFFRYMHKFEDEKTDLAAKGYADNFNSIHWSVNNVNKLHLLYSNAPLSMQCNKSDGQRFTGDWNAISLTKVYDGQKKSPRHCSSQEDVTV